MLKIVPIFVANDLNMFRTLVIDNSSIILRKVHDVYKNNIINIPRGTYFITGVTNHYQIPHDDPTHAEESMIEH